MSITINAKGTSVSSFIVGRDGTLITQAGEIFSPSTTDLTLTAGTGKNVILDGIKYPNADGTAGQILSTNGTGSLSFINPAPNYQEFVATASQTVFNTTMTTTAKGSGKVYLQVFVNGVFQQEGATKQFTVTGANQITFNTGVTLNSDVVIYGYV